MNNRRFEIEMSLSGVDKAKNDLKSFKDELSKYQNEFKKANATTLELERELKNISTAYQRGTVSQKVYNKEVKEISTALASARQAAQQYQARITSLRATQEQASNASRSLGTSLKQVQAYSNDFTGGIRGAYGVTVEFSRVIQDLPYGMIGIGNNLQQLATNWQQYAQNARQAAAESGKVVTTGGLLRGALSSIVSPLNLLTLGISLGTSAWTYYTMSQQKANKATKETEDATQQLVNSLSETSRTLYEAAKSSGSEAAQLRILYGITQDTTKSTEERRKAAKRLIDQYPEQFKNMGTEKILLGEAKGAYDKLSTSILATARAQAAYGTIGEKAAEQIALELANDALEKQIRNLEDLKDKEAELNKERLKNFRAAGNAGSGSSSAATVSGSTYYDDEILKLSEEKNKNLKISRDLQDEINKLEGIAVTNQGKILDEVDKTGGATKKVKDYTDDIVKDSLNYYDAKLFDIQKKYEEIYKTVKDSDLLGLARANEEAEKLRVNMERFLDTTKNIATKPTITPTLSDVPSIAHLLNSSAGKLASQRKGLSTDKELENEIRKSIVRGLGSGLKDLTNDIDKLGSDFYEVFTNVFGKLSGFASGMLADILGKSLGQSLTEKFESGADLGALGSKTGQAIILGAQMAGKVLGSMTSATSYAGQGASGALGGAAAGIAAGAALGGKTGGIWGAAIGGVVGLISGIFGAKKAREQERLQQEQLEEQKKQTLLQERIAALSYQSSIIGQMTNQGIVSGIDRDAFGNLIGRIEGKDIVLAIDRTKAGY